MLDILLQDLIPFVKRKWDSYNVQGNGMFIVKKKNEKLKSDLRYETEKNLGLLTHFSSK